MNQCCKLKQHNFGYISKAIGWYLLLNQKRAKKKNTIQRKKTVKIKTATSGISIGFWQHFETDRSSRGKFWSWASDVDDNDDDNGDGDDNNHDGNNHDKMTLKKVMMTTLMITVVLMATMMTCLNSIISFCIRKTNWSKWNTTNRLNGYPRRITRFFPSCTAWLYTYRLTSLWMPWS